jgi:hypothetical protein
MRPLRGVVLALLAIHVVLIACATSGDSLDPQPRTPATPEVRIGDATFRVEVARTAAERAQGLSGRAAMAAGDGMLFDLGETRLPAFSMRGMLFPLDFVWISADMVVHSVTENVPAPESADDPPKQVSPMEPVRFVLELNAGSVASAGIERGDPVAFSGVD